MTGQSGVRGTVGEMGEPYKTSSRDGMASGDKMAADLVVGVCVDGDIEQRKLRACFQGDPGGLGGEAVVFRGLVRVADDGHFTGYAGLVGEGGVEASRRISAAVDEVGGVLLDGEAGEQGTEDGRRRIHRRHILAGAGRMGKGRKGFGD